MRTKAGYALITVLCSLWLAPLAAQAQVKVLFDLHDPAKTIFPSNLFTVFDITQNTFRRVNLPKPDCTVQPVACDDIDVLNELDGFNPEPRVSIPFSGPIDVASVNSDTVFLLSLGSTLGHGSVGQKIGINQVVWDPATNTLHFKSNDFLDQHTRYAVIVTDGIRDTAGQPVEGPAFARFRRGFGGHGLFRRECDEAMQHAGRHSRHHVVAASVFTTLSTTAIMEKIRRQVHRATPAPATFDVGNGGTVHAVFPVGDITSILAVRQTGTAPTFAPPVPLALPGLQLVPGAVGQLAFGKFSSPDYLAPGESIPAVGTRFGKPVVQTTNDIYFDLFIPAGPKPAGGWPIAIFGHGFGSNKDAAPFVLAAKMAQHGIATIAINVVGHGQGPLGTLTVNTTSGSVAIPIGGRGIDQDGDGVITTTEGSAAAAPRSLLGSTDALRQTDVDLMQLVREIEVGMDIDGDGVGDFNTSRIYYFGQSFGGIYGTMFLAIEPDVRVGVPNVAGGPTIEIVRLSPVFRGPLLTPAVVARGLANLPPVGGIPQFDENYPLRDQPAVINDVPGAMALQEFFDRSEWAGYVGNPVSYAPHLRKSPLRGVPVKSVIFQNAKGDPVVPNPTNTAIIRAGDLADRWTYFRNDLFRATLPTPIPAPLTTAAIYPHVFLTTVTVPQGAAIALATQEQIGVFFESDGTTIIDPDGAGPLFETPIVPPLPEDVNFIFP